MFICVNRIYAQIAKSSGNHEREIALFINALDTLEKCLLNCVIDFMYGGMAMRTKSKSFKKFFYDGDKQNYTIDMLNQYVIKHDGDIGKFENRMFCPECNRAKLSYVHQTSKRKAHLRKIPSSAHTEECSYFCENKSANKTTEYINSLTFNEIQDKLDSVLNGLLKKKLHSTTSLAFNDSDEEKKVPRSRERTADINKHRDIKKKSLNSWIDQSIGNELMLFYGIVKMESVEKEKLDSSGEKYKYFLLKLFTQTKHDKWIYKTTISRGYKKDVIDTNAVYIIAMIGYLDFSYNPFTIVLYDQNSIKFKPIG